MVISTLRWSITFLAALLLVSAIPSWATQQPNLGLGDPFEAEYERALKAWGGAPNDEAARRTLCRATGRSTRWLVGEGRFPAALTACERAQSYAGSSYWPYYCKGVVLKRLGRFREAERSLLEAWQREQRPAILEALADIHFELGSDALALEEYAQVRAPTRNERKVLVRMARSAIAIGQGDLALSLAREADRAFPGDDEIAKLLAGLGGTPLDPQETPEYPVVIDGPFRVRFPDGGRESSAVDRLLRLLPDALASVEKELWRRGTGHVQVVVYDRALHFHEQTRAPDWAGATGGRTVSIPVETVKKLSDGGLSGLLRHEFTHMLVHQRAGSATVPGWLDEGLAQHHDGSTRQTALWRLRQSKQPLISLSKLESCFGSFTEVSRASQAYGQAYLLHDYLEERCGRGTPTAILGELSRGKTAEQALESVTGLTYETLTPEWKTWLDSL